MEFNVGKKAVAMSDQPESPAAKTGNPLLGYAEVGLFALVSLTSLSIGIADFSGILGHTFLEPRIAAMGLVVNGLIAGYLVVERRSSFARMQESAQELNEAIRSIGSRLVSLDQYAAQVGALFEGIAGDRFAELALLYGLRNYKVIVRKNEICGTADQTFELWADSLREANSFLAFNYVSPDEVWGTKGWAFNMAHTLQAARLQLGCTIKRVFVIDTKAEYQLIKPLMDAQVSSGITVKWTWKSEVQKNPTLQRYLKDIGTWDFVCVDNDLVYKVELDDKRHMRGCSLVRSREMSQKAMHVFRESIGAGHDPNQAPQ
jgi:hypothetical protein